LGIESRRERGRVGRKRGRLGGRRERERAGMPKKVNQKAEDAKARKEAVADREEAQGSKE